MPINDLSELIKTMSKPTGKIETSIGEITIFPFTVGNQSNLFSYTLKDENTETMAFYYLLSLVCFPHIEAVEERPDEPFFDLEKIQLLSRKESFYIIEKSGALNTQELNELRSSSSYQSKIVNKINEDLRNSLSEFKREDLNDQLVWMNETPSFFKTLDESVTDNIISRGDIENEKKKRHEATMQQFADLVKHSKFTFGINAEILIKIEKDSKQNKADKKVDRIFNYLILAVGIIGVLIAIFKN